MLICCSNHSILLGLIQLMFSLSRMRSSFTALSQRLETMRPALGALVSVREYEGRVHLSAACGSGPDGSEGA
jgi:hypothetical protein